MSSIPERVLRLQTLLSEKNLDAYVVPSADPHQSEYVADAWKRREFISGFSGSAGLFACNRREAGLWTDGRYFVQAETELEGSGVKLFKQGTAGVPDWATWMIQTLPTGARIGINQHLFSLEAYAAIDKQMKAAGLVLVAQEPDLVDAVWGTERPAMARAPLREHPMTFAGIEAKEKLARVRRALDEAGAGALVVSALDEVAWLFNLRGADVTYNPVFYAFAVVTAQKAFLYVHPDQVSRPLREALQTHVTFAPYQQFMEALKDLEASAPVWLDPQSTSAAVEQGLRLLRIPVLAQKSPLPAWKAVKNEKELQGMRAAHVRDGVAVFRFISWLKKELAKGTKLSEMSVDEQLTAFRARAAEFIGPSFATIAGYGPHGALPHYRATPKSDSELRAEGVFLLDSGAQYVDGTTDITRTMTLGRPTAEHKRIYTAVLKGHLQLARSLFPAGVNGYQLDVLARQPLWAEQLEYNHGTGHGVGAALCVHEGPFSVSKRQNSVALEPGHILSNEPGCYLENRFGVRIENLVTVIKREGPGEFGDFLGFDDLTLCPYDRDLIDVSALSSLEIAQIDRYHTLVYAHLAPRLDAEERSELERATQALKA